MDTPARRSDRDLKKRAKRECEREREKERN